MNKNIIALGVVSFFTDMASSMVTTILPLFIVFVLNEGIDKLGFVVAIATFISYAFRVLFGYLSDKYHIVKPFVVTGYFMSAFTKPLLYFANNWIQIATLRGIERMGKAIRSATKDSLISAYSDKKSGKSFGFHKTMDIAGELIGAIIAFLALYYLGKNEEVFRNIFAWSLIPGILSVIVVVFFVKDVPYEEKKDEFNLKKDYHLLPILFIYFGIVFFMFSDSFFIIEAKNSGIEIAYIPLFVILLNFTQTIFSYYFGVQIDKFGFNKIFLLSIIFGFLSILSLYFDFIILGFVLLGLFLVASLNSIRAFISDNAVNKGSIYGVLYGGVALFSSLGAIVISQIWHNFGEDKAILFSLFGLGLMFFIKVIYARNSKLVS